MNQRNPFYDMLNRPEVLRILGQEVLKRMAWAALAGSVLGGAIGVGVAWLIWR